MAITRLPSSALSLPLPQEIGLSPRFSSFRTFTSDNRSTNQFDIAKSLALSPHRFRGLCMPPGGGKSVTLISSSLIAAPSRTLYLTVNKSLQSQLITEHSDSDSGVRFFSLTGHSSYPCMRNRLGVGTGRGIETDHDSECLEGPNCKYWQDVRASLTYSHVVSNIANWVSIAKVGHADRFGKFDYLILDEAHNLESVLCDLLKVEIDEWRIESLLEMSIPSVSDSLAEWANWGRNAAYNCECLIEEAKKSEDSRLVKKLSNLLSSLEIIGRIAYDWVIQKLPYPRLGASLTPVFASEYVEEYLFRGIDDIILSSATLTVDDFSYLGIEKDQFSLQDIDTGFDPIYRPIYYWPTCAIDYNTSEGEIRQVINRVDRVIESRAKLGWKGLIHSIAYRHSKVIADHSRVRERLLTHNKDNFRSVLDQWLSSTQPNVIVSPIMQEGVDLAHDLCRYQIIWKNPTLDSRDPLVEARKKRDKKYPLYIAGKKLQQMVGRNYRGNGDAGETFIFDLHYGNWMQKSIEWPKYHKRAWRTVRDLPVPVRIPERKGAL